MTDASRCHSDQLFLSDPITTAVIAAVRVRGYGSAGFEDFAASAGIDSTELARRFENKGTVTLAVLDAIVGDFKAQVGAAYRTRPDWPDNLRAAGWEMAAWIRDHPEEVWFGMVGLLDAGDMALARRQELFGWCAQLVDAGRAVAPDPELVPRSAPVLVVGSIVETVRRYEEGTLRGDAFTSVPRIMYGAVRPYLGEEAARRELEVPPPAGWRRGRSRR